MDLVLLGDRGHVKQSLPGLPPHNDRKSFGIRLHRNHIWQIQPSKQPFTLFYFEDSISDFAWLAHISSQWYLNLNSVINGNVIDIWYLLHTGQTKLQRNSVNTQHHLQMTCQVFASVHLHEFALCKVLTLWLYEEVQGSTACCRKQMYLSVLI